MWRLLIPCSVTAPLLLSLLGATAAWPLSTTYYSSSCSKLASIASSRVQYALGKDKGSGAQLLRLLFHDCWVQGCDASIMITNPPDESFSELFTEANKNIGGLDVINDIKQKVEAQCPNTVSCADIIVLAARESVYQLGGPFINVKLGRRDSTTASAEGTNFIPGPNLDLALLNQSFASKNLAPVDLVALSGAHTIGIGHCDKIGTRLNPPDKTMWKDYRHYLFSTCGGNQFNGSVELEMDYRSPNTFDNKYYVGLVNRTGLFTSDQTLYPDDRTKCWVDNFAKNQTAFFQQFSASFIKMSELGVLLDPKGQIRKNCNQVN